MDDYSDEKEEVPKSKVTRKKSPPKKEESSPPRPRGRPKQVPVQLKSDPSMLTSTFDIEKPIGTQLKEVKQKRRTRKKKEEEEKNPEDLKEKVRKYKIKMMEAENIEAVDLTLQDIQDVKQIKEIEKIAELQAQAGVKIGAIDSEDEDLMLDSEVREKIKKKQAFPWKDKAVHDIEMDLDEDGNPITTMIAQYEFLEVSLPPMSNSVQIELRLPIYEGMTKQIFEDKSIPTEDKYAYLTFQISREEIERIEHLLNTHDKIYAFTDGSSLRNPGFSGAGVAFFGQLKENEEHVIETLQAFEDFTKYEQKDQKFLFGLSLDLGQATNNYAEYTGLIVAQILFSLFNMKQAQIYTDSELVVK